LFLSSIESVNLIYNNPCLIAISGGWAGIALTGTIVKVNLEKIAIIWKAVILRDG